MQGTLQCIVSHDDFVASDGWLQRLKERHDIVGRAKGHYVAVKCSSESDCRAWLEALQSHCQQDPQRSFVQPVERPLPCSKRVVIVDLGGCSIRAGILMEQPALPTVYFPSVCSTDRST
ncbi:hypothetical protein HPB51_007530 [Rhipicephalus microplus]|uniref:Uncharacterized protein n=1 Tax=Rhipicephalus microplus TaxID=6941 RepID=A0A9J6E820_RHIMP|nr:hypothetical protein HPB51_007530 [Rhipicephalus microplus]